MEYILFFETWVVLAILFACIEIFVPGGILLNLGFASLLVAVGVYFKILDTWAITLTAWFISASFLLFILYFFTNRLFSSEQTIENTDEELDIYGKEVDVIETIGPGTHAGRVKFQGTSWPALGDGRTINIGEKVTIVCKDNISLVVCPHD